jgi:ligand-binding sensor domain-containing protein
VDPEQPVDQLAAIGGDAQFSVTATGTERLSFQWRLNGIDLEGAHRYNLRILNAQPNQAGNYTVLVTDANGSTISQPAALTVDGEWVVYNRRNCLLPYPGVVDLEVDRDGNVWIATGLWFGYGGGGLARFNGRQWTVYQSSNSALPSDDCTGSTLDAAGNLWISTEAGVACYDRTNQWNVVTRSQTWFPKFDLEGNLWVGSSSGVSVYDGVRWTRYQRANSGLPNDFVAFIAVDNKDRKWISTHGGLAVLDDQTWTIYTTANSGLPHNMVAPIAFDEEGIAWITTWGGGLARFDGAGWTVYNPGNSGLPHANIEDIAIDSMGVKWIATEGGGLARFDGATWRTWSRANSCLPDDVVQALVFDRYQNLWIGMKDGGLAVFREGGVIRHLQIESLVDDGQGGRLLRWLGGQGPYQVQRCAHLGTSEWEDCGGPTDQQCLTVDCEAPARFFRVSDTPP